MPSDYQKIASDNQLRFGTEISRIGQLLLADRYADRTHFLFELLQNAEDALGRRSEAGSSLVRLDLNASRLLLSHFGKPFDESDVRGICGIAESTKDDSSIGRFGIGFKSVYSFTDRPEIHSGDEDFTVEAYVLPKSAARMERQTDETLFVLPLKSQDANILRVLEKGFRQLKPEALLFLRHVDEIAWSIQGGPSGAYKRSCPESLGPNVQRFTVTGTEAGLPAVDSSWLVFSQEIAEEHDGVSSVQIAFSLQKIKEAQDRWMVQRLPTSPLVVYFPTVVPTYLGFLVQGPYRTTQNRDNLLQDHPRNQYLVTETAELLLKSMRWLRDNAMLGIETLRCLPLEREKFPAGSMFAPLFEAVRNAFKEEELLPRFGGGYIAATKAKLARSQKLRDLLSPDQVDALFKSNGAAWIAAEITEDRVPEIYSYLTNELSLAEIRPEALIPNLNREFLKSQSDAWILRLYEFLLDQRAFRHLLGKVPLLRLADGNHVVAGERGRLNAFLPGGVETGFPTIRRSVCASEDALRFLNWLGITEADPVDDVIRNILPRYRQDPVDVDDSGYTVDIERILSAFNTDSKTQRDKLVAELHKTIFVMVVDGDGEEYIAKPGSVYLATDRLKRLFAGVPEVFIVNDKYACLHGEKIRALLEACGVVSFPRPVLPLDTLTEAELADLRKRTGHEQTSGQNDKVTDWALAGFDNLLALLPTLPPEQRGERARLIWESLNDLHAHSGNTYFDGTYSWTHRGNYTAPRFPAAFLRQLNKVAWLPDPSGKLVPPDRIEFSTLGWEPNPFLLAKLAFKPPILSQLAKEAGFDPAILDLLKSEGLTDLDGLVARLGIKKPTPLAVRLHNEPTAVDPESHSPTCGNAPEGERVIGEPADYAQQPSMDGSFSPRGAERDNSTISTNADNKSRWADGDSSGTDGYAGKSNPRETGERHLNSRPFISFIGATPYDEEPDPDGLARERRMQVEKQAIDLILGREPTLHRTPEGNPGYDLCERDLRGNETRWIEVKSMMGTLEDRPVGLTRTQLDFARQHRSAYWLYIVEHATDPKRARVLKIQDPFTKARTFTFDRGWAQVAETDRLG